MVSLGDFKLLLGQEDIQELCDDCREEIIRPPEVTPKVELRERSRRLPTWEDLRDLQRTVDRLSQALTKLMAGLADP